MADGEKKDSIIDSPIFRKSISPLKAKPACPVLTAPNPQRSLDRTRLDSFNIEQVQQRKGKPKPEWDLRQENYKEPNYYCKKDLLFNTDKKYFTKSRCRMFSCSRCRPLKVKITIKNIKKLAHDNNLTRFLTLTIGGKDVRDKISAAESFVIGAKKWKEFKILYKRAFGHSLKYIYLARAHKDGYYHAHSLVDRYIPKKWLNNAMKRINTGNCNIKYVDVYRVGAYLTAYLEKKDHEWFIPKGMHHYSMSSGLSFEKFIPEDDWVFIRTNSPIAFIWRMIAWSGGGTLLNNPPTNVFDMKKMPNALDVALIEYYVNDYENLESAGDLGANWGSAVNHIDVNANNCPVIDAAWIQAVRDKKYDEEMRYGDLWFEGYKIGLVSKDIDIIPKITIDFDTSNRKRELGAYIKGYQVGVNAHE